MKTISLLLGLFMCFSSVAMANTIKKEVNVPPVIPAKEYKASVHINDYPKVIVLMYHRITDVKGIMSLSPEHFAEEMRYLHDNNYNIISSTELVHDMLTKTPPKEKSIVLTFDDGWASQTDAMALLSHYHYPATFALIADTVVKDHKAYITSKDREYYKNEDFIYVNHSKTHEKRDFLAHPETDVPESKAELSTVIKNFTPIYIYPFGARNPRLLKAIKDNGYIAAFGVWNFPVDVMNTDIYNINRYLITDVVSEDEFEKIVAGSEQKKSQPH